MSNESTSPLKTWLAEHLILLTILIGVLLVCAPLLFKEVVLAQPQCVLPNHPHIHAAAERFFELIDKIGDAAIIAGLIGFVVDGSLKTKLIQEVVRAASPKLIGRHLPESIREALLSYFKINFIRPIWEIEFELTLIDKVPDYIRVNSRIKGVVQNCSSDAEQFVFVGSVDASPNGPNLEKSRITRVSMKAETGTDGFDEFPPDYDKCLQSDGTLFYKKTLTMNAGARYTTVLEATECRPLAFTIPLFTATAVANSIVRIRYPKDLLDIQVSTGSSQNLEGESTLWGQEWAVTSALLPGQCILTTWNVKPPLPAQPITHDKAHIETTVTVAATPADAVIVGAPPDPNRSNPSL